MQRDKVEVFDVILRLNTLFSLAGGWLEKVGLFGLFPKPIAAVAEVMARILLVQKDRDDAKDDHPFLADSHSRSDLPNFRLKLM